MNFQLEHGAWRIICWGMLELFYAIMAVLLFVVISGVLSSILF